ncbi:MAG: PQQ-dependent sugar dehydrogenase [Prosthecobacter sp.]
MLRALACLLAVSSTHAQWTSSKIHGSPDEPKPFIAEKVFTQVAMTNGLEMIAVPGAHRFVAVERQGKVWTFPDAPDTAQNTLVIDLKAAHPEMHSAYGIAFHPKWKENGLVFLCYAYGEKVPDGTKLARFKLAQQEPPVLDVASEKVLLTWQSGGHNGASIQFGPDGMLYVSTGDATAPSPPDSLNTGQDISDFLASILRIDVDHEEKGKAYRVPPDNPFVNTPKAMPEVWAFGFRNPWKISFDAKGRLWCGDVGWELWEMIHLVQRGGTHGWSAMEASQPIKPETQRPEPIIPPVAAHPHTEAASITGGYVYHGSRFPELRDAYLYGDYETGKIWALWHDGRQVTRREEIADTSHRIGTFGLSEDGEIYWMDYQHDTPIYRLARNPAVGKPSQFPRKLSETGLFTDTAAQTPAPGVLPFEIAEPMWQDGATAERFVAFPEGRSVTMAKDVAIWPMDTVFARTINWPATKQRLETQVLHFDGETWNGYSYRWNEKGSDAELVGADGEELMVQKQPWRVHGRAECARCHNNWSGFALGFQPDQLVSIQGRPPAETLDAAFLARLKKHLVSSRDEKAAIEDRARSWLHANCAHCHRRHGGGSVQLMVNYDLPTAEAMLINEKPVRGDFGVENAAVVHPFAPQRSILLHRIARTGSGHMPMIGAREPDPHGQKLMARWILSLGHKPAAESYVGQEDEAMWANLMQRREEIKTKRPTDIKEPLGYLGNPVYAMLALLEEWVPPEHREPVIQAGLAAKDANVAALFEQFVPPAQRVKTLGVNIDVPKLLAVKGDARHGAELLSMTGKMAVCLACHIVNGTGRDFGPDLGKVGSRLSREQILESLQHPSKAIAKGYETWVVTLKDNSVQTGFIVNPGDSAVTLKLPSGQPQTFERSQVKSQKAQPASLMPEGLLQSLTQQEAADVIAFLSGLK